MAVSFPRAIARRYRPQRQLALSHLHTLAVAQDRQTGAQVVILSVEAAVTDRVLAGATAAQTLQDPRIPPVIDIVAPTKDDSRAHVITQLRPGTSWERMVADPSLPATFVRAVIGHAAQALHGAAMAGAPHGRLRPEHLLLTRQGLLSILGVGTQGALAGVPQDDAPSGDASALVALAYAGLTGAWPLPPEADPHTPTVRPDDRSGSLAAITSTHRIEALPDRVALPGARMVSGRPVAPAELRPGVPEDLNSLCVDVLRDGAKLASAADVLARLAPWSTDLSGGHESASEVTVATRARHWGAATRKPATREAESAAAAGPATALDSTPDTDDSVEPSPPSMAQKPGVARKRPATQDLGSAAQGSSSPVRQTDATTGDSAGPTRGAAVKGAAVKAGNTAVQAGNTAAVRLAHRLHPDIPTLSAVERRARTKTVVAVLGAVMALGLTLSFVSLRGLGQTPGLNDILGDANPDPTAIASAAPSPSLAAEPVTPTIASVAIRDPLGDNEENDDRAPALIDGDPDSTWASSTYRSAEFSGLKPGLGILVTLQEPATLSTATITQVGQGGALEVRDAPDGTFEGSTALSTVPLDTPTTTITLGRTPTVSKVLLWFTEVPRTNGRYRIELREIDVA